MAILQQSALNNTNNHPNLIYYIGVGFCLIGAILFEASCLIVFKIVDDNNSGKKMKRASIADKPRVCRIFAYYNESEIMLSEYCRS